MFGGFDNRRDGESTKRLALSTGASVGMYGVIGLIAVVVARDPRTIEAAKEVAVVFRAPPPPAAPAPPAPPAPIAPSKPAAVKRVATPAAKPLVDIKQISDAKLDEAEPVQVEYEGSGPANPNAGDGPATPAPVAPPPPAPPPPAPRRSDPINLPEAATPPAPDGGNLSPEYPPEAREKGLEGLVILKVVVTDKGEVTQIQVMKGDEPFVAAALAAVRSWRYSPALVEGQPTAVFRILKIPFRLKS